MNYQNYKVEDFLADEEFKQWVLSPDPQRNQFWSSWLKTHPEKEETVLMAREIIVSIQFKSAPPGDRMDQALSAILKADNTYSIDQKNKFRYSTFLKFAASLIFLISSFSIFYFFQDDINQDESSAALKQIIKSNPAGIKTRIVLPDSSLVWLNAETTLSYPAQFAEAQREVSLSGEAYFEVTENPQKPFIVKTENLQTIVLGTSFNIRTFPDESHIQVSLVSGKVKISRENSQDDLYLEPGQQASYHKDFDRLKGRKFNIEEVLSWKNGVLYFDKENLKKVVEKLERWYGVDITINGNPPKDFVVSGQFHNESLDNVLETMKYGRNFNYTIQNKKVTIEF